MSAMRQCPSTRDAALQRSRRLAWIAGLGGLAAVGTITGMLANAAMPEGSGGGGGSAIQSGGSQQPSSAQNDGTSNPGGGLLPPQSQPGSFSGGSLPHAVSGGSGHR